MSYFVASSISFSKDKKTFKVKWWDNNVVPRWNEWSRDINIINLFYEFDAGDIKYRWISNEKLLKIDHIVQKYRKEINSNKDFDILQYWYYELHRILNQDKNKFNTTQLDINNAKSDYDKKEKIVKKFMYDNYDELKEYIIDFNNRFINDILTKQEWEDKKYYIHNPKQDTYMYKLTKGWDSLSMTYWKNSAKEIWFYQAHRIISSYPHLEMIEV